MILSEAIIKLRRILQDKSSDFINVQGEFWSDSELTLAINEAQLLFCNYALKSGFLFALQGLIADTGASFATSGQANQLVLPNDYMHYMSATVQVEDYNPKTQTLGSTIKMAKFYTVAESETFKYIKHTAAVLTAGNKVEFYTRGKKAKGTLFYYKYPRNYDITTDANVNLDDFTDYIYLNIILPQASVLAGLKDVQNKRDSLRESRLIDIFKSMPHTNELNLPDVETINGKLRKQQNDSSNHS